MGVSRHFKKEGCQPGFLGKRKVLVHYLPLFCQILHKRVTNFPLKGMSANPLHPPVSATDLEHI